jgi:hypothetical protein
VNATLAEPHSVLHRRGLKPDEWPETYLAALVRMNGVRKPASFDVDRIRSFLPKTAADKGTSYIDDLTMQRCNHGRPQYGALPLPKWASLHRRCAVRYCPICFTEDRYVRTRWRLPQLMVCSRHGCYLKSDAAEPAFTAGIKRRLLVISEATDEEILKEAVCCLPNEFEVCAAVWGPLERAVQLSPHPFPDDEVGELAAWSLLAWRLLERVAQAHVFGVLRAASMGMLANIALMVGALGVSIAPSREGVLCLLRSLRYNVHHAAALRCIRELIKAERKDPTILGKLPLAELEELLAAAAPQMAVPNKAGHMVFQAERERALSLRQAMHELGANQFQMNHWLRARWFPRVEIRRNGAKRFLFIHRDDVRNVRKYLLSLISVEDFVAEHDLDWPTYLALRRAGVLKPICIGDRRYLRRTDLAVLVSRLELASCPQPAAVLVDRALFSRQLVSMSRFKDTYSSLVQAAIEAEFPVFRDLDRPGLSSFRVGIEALTWINARRSVDWSRGRSSPPQQQFDFTCDAA